MKKELKILFIIIVTLILIWLIIFCINFVRCKMLKAPILMKANFVKVIHLEKDVNGNEYYYTPVEYTGIGYKIESKNNKDKIIDNQMYLFNSIIKSYNIKMNNK